ncbi:DUF2062 domain-containing protein [Maritimibacter sp. UBA3975]|uniref:DUF2062 domain-containing protein n=1 Tax=Maritimibacter sp. UBA3975 TaxID=1946833 RepID=UPI000C0A1876|nr:DUF2062 domain-containing protein [Maritimibacter sp. UBA3975]MAM61895.1 hypothetical protein [Maritimibacter sp.]|tara:strand:+ start:10899 stop:11543 length:645 start_codon:yes stop_codon:yes gene_type:complete
MFKRKPRSYLRTVLEFFYPRGGWYRATRYVIYRLRRLPDPAHRISRGIAAGVLVSFTPLFGLHFLTAAFLAWVVRGNLLAAVLATFVGNPITFPFIAGMSMRLGNRILGNPVGDMRLPQVVDAFANASGEIWHNVLSAFTWRTAHWDGLGLFFDRVFLPYLVGGLLPGLGAAFIAYGLSRPVITAYQKRRVKQLRKRYEKRMAERTRTRKEGDT